MDTNGFMVTPLVLEIIAEKTASRTDPDWD
jgi:hypothetical protein